MGLLCSKNIRSLSQALENCQRAHDDPDADGDEIRTCCLRLAKMLAAQHRGQSFKDFYDRLETVSYGASSTVSRARDKVTGEDVAIKVIPKQRGKVTCQNGGVGRKAMRQRVLFEIAAMKAVAVHKNTGQLRELFEDDRNYYLVMDYYSGGELFDHIISQKKGFTECQAALYMRDLMEFLKFSHSRGLVHADVKPENIMLSSDGPEAVLKVIDFGLSFFARPHERCRNIFGTVNYCSPEMANDETGQKTDIWSAGVMLYFMLSGKAPFRLKNREATLNKLKNAPRVAFTDEIWDRVSSEAKDFIRGLLEPEPQRRPSAKEALELPWLRDLSVSSGSSYTLDFRAVTALRRFTQRSKVCRKLLEMVASTLTHEQVAEQLSMFSQLDADNNGVVDYQELRAAIHEVHPELDDHEVSQLFSAIDMNRSGNIDCTEFVAATIPALDRARQEELIRSSFFKLDRSGSGFIPKQELKDAFLKGVNPDELTSIDHEEMERQLEAMDSNKDGVITIEEFRSAMVSTEPNSLVAVLSDRLTSCSAKSLPVGQLRRVSWRQLT